MKDESVSEVMAATRSDDAGTKAAPPGSIESLYAAQESALLLYAQRLLDHDESAQDVVQEAFMRLHVHYDTVRQPRAWLYRTVHNLAMNHLRASRKLVPLNPEESEPRELPDHQPLPDEQMEWLEAVGQTRLCLAGLDERRRELLRLKFEENLSYKEISARTHLSLSNVGYLLHHTLKEVAAALNKAGVMP